MKIKVITGAGDKLSPDPIIDELMATEAVATERGKMFLSEESSHKWIYDIEKIYEGWKSIGDLVEVNDSQLGEVFRGKLTAFSLNMDFSESEGVSATVNCTVERSDT